MSSYRGGNTFVLVYLLIGLYLWTGFRTLCELQYAEWGQTAQGRVVQVCEYMQCGKSKTRMLGVAYEFVDSAGMTRGGQNSYVKANAPYFYMGQTIAVQYIPGGDSCRLLGTTYWLEVAGFFVLSAIGVFVWLCSFSMERLLR